MKPLILNAELNHKQTEYNPQSCIVEKVIKISHDYFERMKGRMLSDNPYISENKELMYQDDEFSHCLLFVDYITGDGLLVESVGDDYWRKSQFIPGADALLKQNDMTDAERELHNKLKELVDVIAEKAHCGEMHFCLQDLINESELDVNHLLRSAVGEMIGQRDDVNKVDVFHSTVDFQSDIRVQVKETKTIRLVCPLEIRTPEYNEYGDYIEDEIMSSRECAKYADEVNKFIEGYEIVNNT